jgi:(p)ppGpp synthase/HD superfamily hydrolase
VTAEPILSERLAGAFGFALDLHRSQTRKGTAIPYLSHPMAVAALVLEDGGDEEQAIAALLHDGPEDQGGRATLEEIRRRFGDGVARIVDGLTDTYESPKPPWLERKRAYLARLAGEGEAVLRVAAADKVHNARSILEDYRELGERLWARFNAGPEEVLWYFRELVEILGARHPGRLADELRRTVSEIEVLRAEVG